MSCPFLAWIWLSTSSSSKFSSSTCLHTSMFSSRARSAGLAPRKSDVKLLKSGDTTISKNPHWDFEIPPPLRSMSADTSPKNSLSLSPCRKYSSSRPYTHCTCTEGSAMTCPRSAILMATCKASFRSSRSSDWGLGSPQPPWVALLSGMGQHRPSLSVRLESTRGVAGAVSMSPMDKLDSLSRMMLRSSLLALWTLLSREGDSCPWNFSTTRWNCPIMWKCDFMSVPRTISIISARSMAWSSTAMLCVKLQSACLMSLKAAHTWWFSRGLRSLYWTAISSPVRTRKSLLTPLCS
mmetsp:Transcript_30413/g.85134  ORF Transcript_30413/g.85134 Transcript_30413/m.85134 type:complete len:294 (-) Transcript_30413:429-1310(-)